MDPELRTVYRELVLAQQRIRRQERAIRELRTGIKHYQQNVAQLPDVLKQLEDAQRENCILVNRINEVMLGRAFPTHNPPEGP